MARPVFSRRAGLLLNGSLPVLAALTARQPVEEVSGLSGGFANGGTGKGVAALTARQPVEEVSGLSGGFANGGTGKGVAVRPPAHQT